MLYLLLNQLTLLFNGEINNKCFCWNLRSVMRITEFSGDVESKIRVILHFLVTKFDI